MPFENVLDIALCESEEEAWRMERIPRKAYTYEFMLGTVRLVESGQRIAEAARSLGVDFTVTSSFLRTMVMSRDAAPAIGASGAGSVALPGTGLGPALMSSHSPRARKMASLQRGRSELAGPGATKVLAAGVASGLGETRK